MGKKLNHQAVIAFFPSRLHTSNFENAIKTLNDNNLLPLFNSKKFCQIDFN